ncbi:DNA-binding protein [Pseudoduganella sp. OTU4001]|uniref:DNA-binding protein n=1 Tax=Pseudoduganella sp. OTU4001 TaxID=3043854 RepID=UPI00313DCA4E
MTVEEQLLHKFGPMLDVYQLSELLNKSPEAVRSSLRTNGSWANCFNDAKVRLGRRIYFRTSDVASLLNVRA